MKILAKKTIWLLIPALLAALPAWAGSETAGHSVTIHVPPTLSLAASQNHLDLIFPQNAPGGIETNSLTVTYSVKSNGMSQADGAPAVLAQLSSVFPGMELKASVGSFVKRGGNTELASAGSGFVNIQSAQTALLTKQNSSGDGQLLHGDFPVTYKAVAKEALTAGDHSRQLILTLTDI